jgi:hypothetical protein
MDIEKLKALCKWLREHSSGIYRPSAEAATVIEELIAEVELLWRERAILGRGFGELTTRTMELSAEIERLRARFEYIEDHATTSGGGNGFTVTLFVPADHEDIGCGIDAAIEKEKA